MAQVQPLKLANLKAAWSQTNTNKPDPGQSATIARCPLNATRLKPVDEFKPAELITLRERIWNLFDDPGSSQAAQFLGLFMMLVIIVSSGSFILQTVPELHDVDASIWRTIEVVSISIFTIEFSIRFLFSMSKKAFTRDQLKFLVVIRISNRSSCSNIPCVQNLSICHMGLSLLRCYKGFRTSSRDPAAERGDWDDDNHNWIRSDGTKSPYYSIPASFWWCIITMTTVGYGDDVPITATGRIIAGITSLCGILVLAIPITIISANFNTELEKMLRQKDIDFEVLGKLREELDRAYYRRAEIERALLRGSEGVWSKDELAITPDERELFKTLGVINEEIKASRQKLTEFIEEQIKHILNKNLEGLLKQIGEMVQRQKLISSNQIKSILSLVPRFVEEPNPWRQQTTQWFQTMTCEIQSELAGYSKPDNEESGNVTKTRKASL